MTLHRRVIQSLVLFTALSAAGLVSAQEDSDDPYAPLTPPQSGEIESAEASNLLNPNISAIATFALGYFSGNALPPSGHDPTRTGISLQEIEIGFQAAVDPYFRTDIFLALSEHGFELEEGTLKSLCLPTGLQLEVGKLLAEFGRHNTRHLEMWDFVDNNLTNRLILGDHGLSTLGVELSYIIPTGSRAVFLRVVAEALEAHTMSFGGHFEHEHEEHEHEEGEHEGEEETHEEDAAEADGHSHAASGPFEELYLAALGRIESAFTINPEWTLMIGVSTLMGPNLAAEEDWGTRLYGTDIYLRYRSSVGQGYTTVALGAEGMRLERDFHDETAIDHGLYGTLFWRFALRWNTALRFGMVDGDTVGEPMRGSAQVTFHPSEFSRVRAQYNALFPHGDTEAVEHQAFLQVEFSIGPHGAHPF